MLVEHLGTNRVHKISQWQKCAYKFVIFMSIHLSIHPLILLSIHPSIQPPADSFIHSPIQQEQNFLPKGQTGLNYFSYISK